MVITGGPYSGKTTLVEALGRQGHGTVPEAAIDVIAELNEELGIEGQKKWRFEHRTEFQLRVLRLQVRREEEALRSGEGPVFLDRSRLDGIAYCRHYGTPPPPELLEAAERIRYDHVFVLDTLSHVHVRTASGRTSDRATSLALRERIVEVYAEYGYEPVPVPEMSVEERVRFVLERIGLR